MKRFFIGSLLVLLGCTSFGVINGNLSEDDILKHVNYVAEDLQNQGFSGIIGKAKESKIYVPANVNGIGDDFFIDTGASFTFLNQQHISKYKLQKLTKNSEVADIKTFFGNIARYDKAAASEFRLGGCRFRPWPFIIHEGDNDPVLGSDFLHFTNTVLICKYATMFFNVDHQKADCLSDTLKNFGYKVFDLSLGTSANNINKISYLFGGTEFEQEIGVFYIEADFNGARGIIFIDTGAPFTAIDEDVAKFSNSKIKKQYDIYFQDAAGNIEYPSVIFSDSLKIEDYFVAEKKLLPVFKDLNTNKDLYQLPVLGVIGMDDLVRNNAIIDYGNRKMYMAK